MDAAVVTAFGIGLFLGANIGLVIACLCVAAKNRDRWMEEER